MNRHERIIALLLRIDAAFQLTALVAVFLPFDMMQAIHAWLGLGPMPDAPIVGYLARCLSGFYALHGAITLYLSLDVRKHWLLIRFWAILFVLLGVCVMGIDLVEGMPLFWTLSEGPFVVAFGAVILWLMHRAEDTSHWPHD